SDSTTTDSGNLAAASSLPECKAQRAVYVVAGNGALSWFTLVWPAPAVINNFLPQYAYDNPAAAKDVSTTAAHPLFARKIGTRAVWQARGSNPQPSVFVAGSNETHTNTPSSIVNSATAGNLAGQGAAIQTTLPSTIPVMTFGTVGPYTAVPGAPLAINVSSLDTAIAAFNGRISAAQQQVLRPTAAQLSHYVPAGATTAETDFGTDLAFAFNAFKLGLINTVMIPAFRDDPHGAFDGGIAGPRADHLAAALDAFYTDLVAAPEPSCSHAGQQITLADNVVTVVDGDTPKNSFTNAGWPDGTPGNSNWLYLRSNGFTKPGWFGDIEPTGRTNFDPTTGLTDPTAAVAPATAATYAGVLYSIARGDKARVTTVTSAPFDGVIK
ncbi:MAG TPA: hypothetical protein VK601_17860, partial [Kofleriaceae bacterium]|nr:hypothetical protein [Kofleriaceae bacterium]